MLSADKKFQAAETMRKSVEEDRKNYLKERERFLPLFHESYTPINVITRSTDSDSSGTTF
jgi:hypothetical protein